MKLYRKKGHILVVSERSMDLLGLMAGVGKNGKGAAIYPFLFVREESFATPVLTNHELIHFRQQIETLFIGSWLINLLERQYAKLFLKKRNMESYTWKSSEQEAYRNQYDLEYLKNRKLWARFNYFKNKKKITFPEPGMIVIE